MGNVGSSDGDISASEILNSHRFEVWCLKHYFYMNTTFVFLSTGPAAVIKLKRGVHYLQQRRIKIFLLGF